MTSKVWNDPLGYDPLVDGPPYFRVGKPQGAMVPKMASLPRALSAGPLGSLVAFLRGLAIIHQGHHWLTSGPQFYADHLLFERLYVGTVEDIDPLAERAVGIGGGAALQPYLQANLVHQYTGKLYASNPLAPSPEQMVQASLDGEDAFLQHLKEARSVLESTLDPALISGVMNLLDGVGDKHQSHLYLLRQRAWSL